GEPIRHQGRVHAVAFGPEDQTLLTGSGNARGGAARLWRPATDPPPLKLPDAGTSRAVASSPDGQFVLTGGETKEGGGFIRLCKTATGEELWKGRQSAKVQAVAFSPGRRLVLIGDEGGFVRLWQVGADKPLWGPKQVAQAVYAVAFSPDGSTFV